MNKIRMISFLQVIERKSYLQHTEKYIKPLQEIFNCIQKINDFSVATRYSCASDIYNYIMT